MYEEFVRFVRDYYRTDQPIPLHAPCLSETEKDYLTQVIDSGFVSSAGERIAEFEARVADYTGAGYAVATVNGTAALHVALLLAGVEAGDEVITQSLTFVATANAIRYCDAAPVFVDVERATLGMSPDALEDFLGANAAMENGRCTNRHTGRRIAACVPMHTFGHPARIDRIVDVCERYGIAVVEDAAEALGSRYQDRHVGTFGRLGILSFNGNKIITTGGGGMILSNDSALAERAKHLTTTAKLPHRWEFVHDEVGFNYRMPNLNAALGLAQLTRLDGLLAAKRRLADAYRRFFQQQGVEFSDEPMDAKSNYWLNAIVFSSVQERDGFLEMTNDAGIHTRPAWMPMHRLSMYQQCVTGGLGMTEQLYQRLVNLPSSAIVRGG